MEQIIILLVFGAISLVNWWLRKRQEGDAADVLDEPAPIRPGRRQDSEEERVRKFLEALGVPQGDAPPVARPRVERPPIPTGSAPPPVPVARPRIPVAVPKPATPPPIPKVEPVEQIEEDVEGFPEEPIEETEPMRPEWHPPGIAAVPAPEPIQVEALTAPEMESLPPIEEEVPTRVHPVAALLASRKQLRSAILLREILGPPRGLHSSF